MIRQLDEIRTYTQGLKTYLTKLGGMPIDKDQVMSEMFRSLGLLTDYLGDTVDTIEKEYNELQAQVKDIQDDSNRYSVRSTALINDVVRLDKRVLKVEELEAKVDNLTNILLRSLKDIPVKGAEGPDIEEKSLAPFHKTIQEQHDFPNGDVIAIPQGFIGTVKLNAVPLRREVDFKVEQVDNGPHLYSIYGPIRKGDIIEFSGHIRLEDDEDGEQREE